MKTKLLHIEATFHDMDKPTINGRIYPKDAFVVSDDLPIFILDDVMSYDSLKIDFQKVVGVITSTDVENYPEVSVKGTIFRNDMIDAICQDDTSIAIVPCGVGENTDGTISKYNLECFALTEWPAIKMTFKYRLEEDEVNE